MLDEDAEDLFEAVALLRRDRDEAEVRFRNAQQRLIDYLTANRRKSATVNNRKFTLVVKERTIIDEDGLKKGLGARTWNSLTVRKLDRRRLEAAIESGSVDPVVVAQYSSVKRDAPFINITDAKE